MSKIGGWFTGLRQFLEEVRLELSKCTWPTRPELMESTVVIVVSCVLLSLFVGLSDVLLMSVLKVIIR